VESASCIDARSSSSDAISHSIRKTGPRPRRANESPPRSPNLDERKLDDDDRFRRERVDYRRERSLEMSASASPPRNLPLIFDTFAPGYVHAACMYLGYILYIDCVYCFIAQALRSNAGASSTSPPLPAATAAVRSPDLGKVT